MLPRIATVHLPCRKSCNICIPSPRCRHAKRFIVIVQLPHEMRQSINQLIVLPRGWPGAGVGVGMLRGSGTTLPNSHLATQPAEVFAPEAVAESVAKRRKLDRSEHPVALELAKAWWCSRPTSGKRDLEALFGSIGIGSTDRPQRGHVMPSFHF